MARHAVTWTLLALACGAGCVRAQIVSMGSVTATPGEGSFGPIGNIEGEIDPATWHLWTFEAAFGDVISWRVERTTPALDPIAAIYAANLAGRTLDPFGTLIFEAFGLDAISVGDDNQPPATGFGPFGDPSGGFVAPFTTTYSILIGSFESEAGPQDYLVSVFGSSFAATEPCNAADVAPFLGVLDVNDLIDFVNAFNEGGRQADVSPPGGDGMVNVNDVIDFINAFNAGCP